MISVRSIELMCCLNNQNLDETGPYVKPSISYKSQEALDLDFVNTIFSFNFSFLISSFGTILPGSS